MTFRQQSKHTRESLHKIAQTNDLKGIRYIIDYLDGLLDYTEYVDKRVAAVESFLELNHNYIQPQSKEELYKF